MPSIDITVGILDQESPPSNPFTLFWRFKFELRKAESYFRFHHFLLIIHKFHNHRNYHISIQKKMSVISSTQANITLCFFKLLGFSTKTGWKISKNELVKLSVAPNMKLLLLLHIRTASHLLFTQQFFPLISASLLLTCCCPVFACFLIFFLIFLHIP